MGTVKETKSSAPHIDPGQDEFDKIIDYNFSPGDEKTMELRAKETSGGIENKASIAEQQEIDATHEGANSPQSKQNDGIIGRGYKTTNNSTSHGRFKKALKLSTGAKVAGGGGILTTLLLMFFFFFMQGPGEVVHFAQLLERFHFSNDVEFMDNRTGQLIKNARTVGNEQRRNLGYFGNRFGDHFEKKMTKAGLKPSYEAGRIRSISIDTTTDTGKKAKLALEQRGVDFSSPEVKRSGGTYTIDLTGTSARYRRLAITDMVQSMRLGNVSTAVSSRLLKVRAGVDFHPLKNITRALDEKIDVYSKRIQQKRAERIRTGDPTPSRFDADGSQDANGNPTPPDADSATGASGANEVVGGSDPVRTRAAKLKANLTSPAGLLTFLTMTCGLKAISSAVSDLQFTNLILPLMRTGMDIIATGSQVQAGKGLNFDELGAVSSDFYDNTTKTSWAGARSIQAELGEKQTGPDIPDSARPGQEKPQFLQKVDSIIAAVPGGSTVCSAVNSTTGGFIVSALGSLGGGPLTVLGKFGIDQFVSYATAPFIEDVVRWLAGDLLEKNPKGALLGNFANFGARLAANDVSLTHGGAALSSLAASELRQDTDNQLAAEFRKKPLSTRLLDRTIPDSAISKLIYQHNIPSNGQTVLASITKIPGSVKTIMGTFISIFRPSVLAATTPYDFGFPEYGYSTTEIENPAYEDPYANAALVEPRLDALNSKYGLPCFGLTIDPTTFAITTSADSVKKRYVNLSKDGGECNNRSNIELTQYRFYLADMSAAKAIACYEGLDEASCNELGFGATSTASPTSTSGGLAQPIINKFIQSPNPSGNAFIYNVSNADSCFVVTVNPPVSQQPFIPTLNVDTGVTAGNGGGGTLHCTNQGQLETTAASG